MKTGVTPYSGWTAARDALHQAGFSRLPDLNHGDRPMFYKPSRGQYATMDWRTLSPPVVDVTVRGTVL